MAGVPFTVTVAPAAKFVPVAMTVVPTDAEGRLNPVIVGAGVGSTVKVALTVCAPTVTTKVLGPEVTFGTVNINVFEVGVPTSVAGIVATDTVAFAAKFAPVIVTF